MHAEDGISIPASYTAFLAPISSSKLFNEARASKDDKSLETPYVVMFQSINILSGLGGGISGACGPRIQACWEFEHPCQDIVLDAQGESRLTPPCPLSLLCACQVTALLIRASAGLPITNSHNTRSATLTFHIPHGSVLHGLAGYFEAVLYGNVGLSIHPERMDRISKDMLSWFPLFFPFKVRRAPPVPPLHSPPFRFPAPVSCRSAISVSSFTDTSHAHFFYCSTGAAVPAQQLRAARLDLAADDPAAGLVRVVRGGVPPAARRVPRARARRAGVCPR